MFCHNCGKELDEKAIACPHCGVATRNFESYVDQMQADNAAYYASSAYQGASSRNYLVSGCNRGVALLLCFFLGTFGVHRFYVGKISTGIIYLCTFGLLGFGWLIDVIRIAMGDFTDSGGYKLLNWTN